MLSKKVSDYISQHRLLEKEKLHLVALSGGADSVCLLLLMKQMGYEVHAVHCNFHLRGEESDRDEQFCIALCEANGVALHRTHFDTKLYAEVHKVSIEMAARELRYAYFEQLREALGAEDIVVAHHRDDNVETVLMNMLRGTGIHGLQGIRPRNGRIVRPLLCVSREDITDFLAVHQQTYVTDSTNLVDEVLRNKIRLNVIPLLKELNPAAVENIQRTAENVAEAVKVVDAAIEESVEEVVTRCSAEDDGEVEAVIDVEALKRTPSPEQTLFAILRDYGFAAQQIRQVYGSMSGQSGRVWQTERYTLAMDRNRLLLGKAPKERKTMTLPEAGIYIYNERAKISVASSPRPEGFQPSKDAFAVTLDADKVRFPLTLRGVTEGDRFQPFGMKGTKLVSDYLTDRKCNYFQRQRQLVVTDARGEVLWLVGRRVSQSAACTDDTINILTVRYIIQ